jgi:hypothetical protein
MKDKNGKELKVFDYILWDQEFICQIINCYLDGRVQIKILTTEYFGYYIHRLDLLNSVFISEQEVIWELLKNK